MNMKLKTICIALALFSFSTYTFAKPATYSFSGFGGGLPSSATRISASDDSDVPTKQRIIVEDDETEDTNTSDEEPSVNKNKKGARIATYVILGAVVTAGIVVGAIYLSSESADCCSSASDSMMKGCGEGCSESCNKSMEDACSESVSEACSSSSNSSSCNSSSGNSTVDCSSSSINALMQGNVALIPVFIP